MKKLLMISGDRALAEGKHGAFYNTLGEFHKYWDRIDIITPPIDKCLNDKSLANGNWKLENSYFGNVFIHSSPWPLIFQSFWIFKKGQEIFRQNKFDLITCHDYPPFYNGFGAFILWLFIKAPYVLEFHHITGYPKSANLKEWWYKIYAKIFVAIDSWPARAVRVVNQHQTKEFLVKAGVPESKIIYIPSLYIDNNIFKPTNEPKVYDLIFVGRLEENKGIKTFLDVVRQSNLKAIIVGDGPLKKYVDGEIGNWKMENVKCFGWAKDSQEIANLLNKSKLFILTSYNEGGPRVVVEAMACGVPVLATPVGIVPDLKDACTVIDWDVEDIIKKVRYLLNDPTVYESQVKAGLEVAKQFNKESAVKNYAEKVANLIQ